jgi:hypothetical protein
LVRSGYAQQVHHHFNIYGYVKLVRIIGSVGNNTLLSERTYLYQVVIKYY